MHFLSITLADDFNKIWNKVHETKDIDMQTIPHAMSKLMNEVQQARRSFNELDYVVVA